MGRMDAPAGALSGVRVAIVPWRVARDRALARDCEPALYEIARSEMLCGAQGPLTEAQHDAASARASIEAMRTVTDMRPEVKRRIRPRSPVRRVAVVVHRVDRAPVRRPVVVSMHRRPAAREHRPCGARRRHTSSSPKASGDSSGEPAPGEPPGDDVAARPSGGAA